MMRKFPPGLDRCGCVFGCNAMQYILATTSDRVRVNRDNNMRKLLALALAAWCLPTIATAQVREKFQPPEIKKLHIGFKSSGPKERELTAYKVGLWTPIYIEVFGGTDGIKLKPNQDPPYLEIETSDSEDVGTIIRLPCTVPELEDGLFVGFVKTGHFSVTSREIKVTLKADRRTYKPATVEQAFNLNMDAHLYLTLGPRNTDFHSAVSRMGKQRGDDKDANAPFDDAMITNAVYEDDVRRLPERWFGYQSVDLMILSDQRKFVTELGKPEHRERLGAITQWVRRGGRLVVPISAANQDAMHALLKNEAAWQPAIPVVPPKVSQNLLFEHLKGVDNWKDLQAVEPFTRKGGIAVSTLDPGKVEPGAWDVSAFADENNAAVPLIAHVRYGLGQITYLAFSLQDDHFGAWKGREKFMQELVKQLAPKVPARQGGGKFDRFGRFDEFGSNDPATQLLAELERFGVTPIEFGYVALFIVLYILVVGPLDFFLLKYVFKRLEWTWITFPAVVLGVSVIAYFAAYALKGKDLKVNKVDIVDFDLRTSKDPAQARVYGHTFFAVLSPRIQNYTIGIEPNPHFWGEEPRQKIIRGDKTANEVLRADLVSWFGRPTGGMNEMGRGGSGGFFRKPYEYLEDASGLNGVPIPVWTTKAFTASWEQPLAKPPFVADLVYHQKLVKQQDLKISGKLENHLGVDLVDVWLGYDQKFYLLEGGLKSVKNGAAPMPIAVASHPSRTVLEWIGENDAHDDAADDGAATAQQTRLVKQILVHSKFDSQNTVRNYLLRPLDLGWRMVEEPRGQTDRRTREAILFARVRYPAGSAEALTSDAKKPLPTNLWLQGIPETGHERPGLSGQLNQDTYIRVILPLRPADE